MIQAKHFLIIAAAVPGIYWRANEAGGAIQTAPFAFATGAEPAFHFASGDLPCDVIAEVSGSFVLQYDEVTGDALLNNLQAILTSAQNSTRGQSV